MSKFFSVTVDSVISLTAEGAVCLARSIFRAECRYAGLAPTALTISLELTVADGGIDAEINSGELVDIPSDCLFQSGVTGVQIKAGKSFKPWQKAAVTSELLNNKEELDSEVEFLLKKSGQYTLYCTGHDLTSQQRNKARSHIIEVFKAKGYEVGESKIEVLGASQIAEYAERYPEAASLLSSDPVQEAWVFDEWRRDAHMTNPLQDSTEQLEMISQIRNELQGNAKHIRLLGEPGLGKTRLILEAVSDKSLFPIVLYFQNGAKFGQTNLFRQLIKSGGEKPLILILDDLSESELIDIWRHLKPRCGHLKIISLDHGRDKTNDEDILYLNAPHLQDETIGKILINRIGNSEDIRRWIPICEGSPRVAQAVAENLYSNPNDVLKPPTTVPLWTRFLHGHSRLDGNLARQVDCVARNLALFSRFGYEEPVGAEAEYIFKLIESMDPSIGRGRFQEIIQDLRERRVLQGNRTLFFVPKALHIYLWKEFWAQYGLGFNFTDTFHGMPESLHTWFLNMFKYANEDTANSAVKDILRVDGVFASRKMIESEKGSRFISILAEANPASTLKLLEMSIARWSDQELLGFKGNRQNIVWALEKIAVWPNFTVRAINVLIRMALTENAHYSNNSKGTLVGLFRIGVESAPTESPPEVRLPALLKLLQSTKSAEYQLGIEAMLSAVCSGGFGSRIVGPEYQGLKERANLWKPATYGELWDAWFLYFKAFFDETQSWTNEKLLAAHIPLFKMAEQLVTIQNCTKLSFTVFEYLTQEGQGLNVEWKRIYSSWSDSELAKKYPDIAQKIRSLKRRNCKKGISDQFQRYVVDVDYADFDEEFRHRHDLPKSRTKQLIRAFARKLVNTDDGLNQIKHLFTSNTYTPGLWHFGKELASVDVNLKLLPSLIQAHQEASNHICLQSYLVAIRVDNETLYTETVGNLLSRKDTASSGVNIALRADYEKDHFILCLEALEKGWVLPAAFDTLARGDSLSSVSSEEILRLFSFLDKIDSPESLKVLVRLLDESTFDSSSAFSADFVRNIVSRSIPRSRNSDQLDRYLWKRTCLKLCEWDQSQVLLLLDILLRKMGEAYEASYNSYILSLADELVGMNPVGSWQVIAQHFERSLPQRRDDLQTWLKGELNGFDEISKGVISVLPVEDIMTWVSVDAVSRAPIIAHTAPQTLDDNNGGQLTKRLLCSYSDIDGVISGISSVFNSGGWTGPMSLHLKKKRSQLRVWLSAGFEIEVIHWIESEIEYLDQRIQQAETDEERTRFD